MKNTLFELRYFLLVSWVLCRAIKNGQENLLDALCNYKITRARYRLKDTLFQKSNLCPKIQFWQNFTFRHKLNFCNKVGRYSWIFHSKMYWIVEFSCQKSRFWPIFRQKFEILQFLVAFQIQNLLSDWVLKVKFTTVQVEFLDKKWSFWSSV